MNKETAVLTEILGEFIRRNPIRSQREACTVAARRAIAAFGPVTSDAEIRDACIGLCSGLFANADATDDQQDAWIAMMEEEYRKCLRLPAGER